MIDSFCLIFNNPTRNIGFISTRLAGTDGVSLEVQKWARVLQEMGHRCYFFAGESDWPEDVSYVTPKAHFNHPEIEEVTKSLFASTKRDSKISGRIQALRFHLKKDLYDFVKRFNIQILIAENVLSIPMNIPLGLALTEFIVETGLPCIGHHHDFSWERKRFALNGASDYLRSSFPPVLPRLKHVVINSAASQELAWRTGASSMIIPNVMDFDNPVEPTSNGHEFRKQLGIAPEEYLILQPTRIVPRKRIERAIELVRRLEMECALVISHQAGDEGLEYQEYLQEYAEMLNVKLILAHESISYHCRINGEQKKSFSLQEAYENADLVTYPSTIEGFGNAFLETIFYKKPIVMSSYSIFQTDIKPKGFRVIEFDEVIGHNTVLMARQALRDTEWAKEMVEHNFELGKRHYSFKTLNTLLFSLLNRITGA